MKDKKPKEKLVVYIRSAEGEEELLDEQDLDPEKGIEAIGDALFDMSLGHRTPVNGARFLLNMRDIKGNERRRLRAIVERHVCQECIKENKGKCIEGHSDVWIKKILA